MLLLIELSIHRRAARDRSAICLCSPIHRELCGAYKRTHKSSSYIHDLQYKALPIQYVVLAKVGIAYAKLGPDG